MLYALNKRTNRLLIPLIILLTLAFSYPSSIGGVGNSIVKVLKSISFPTKNTSNRINDSRNRIRANARRILVRINARTFIDRIPVMTRLLFTLLDTIHDYVQRNYLYPGAYASIWSTDKLCIKLMAPCTQSIAMQNKLSSN